MGLIGMRERAPLLGGTFEIESSPGLGTTVFARIPLNRKEQERMNKVRIILADDHTVLRQGLTLLINKQPDMEVVGDAGDGPSAVRLAQELKPDLIVMDVSMPEMNGLEATKQLKKALPQIKILPLTRHNDSSYLQQLLQAGADGYVLKQSSADELIHAIRAVLAGGTYLDPTVAAKVVTSFAGRLSNWTIERTGVLTDREAEILRLIARGHSNKEIATSLGLSVKTIEAHKAHSMKKLGLRNRIEIIRYAMLSGWLQGN
jgi:DNA-binding NarL/FixJ family response regulator